MLKYLIIENTSDYVVYRYFPDGKTEFGEIKVRKSDKAILEQRVAANDEYRWCFLKLLKRMREFIDADNFEKEGIIAWY